MDWEEQPNSIAVVRIEPLERTGDGVLVWYGIQGMWVGEEDEAGWEDWASEFEAIAGTAMYQMINAQHMPSGRAFSEPEETDTARAVEQAHLHLKTLVPVTFPDVPIGVGGVWEVHDYAEVSGIGMRMQRVFRVKSISGQRVTIETAQRHVGTPGPMPPMGSVDADRELLVRELLITGWLEMDLGLVAPIFGELHGETKTRIRVHRDDDWFEVASLANFRHTWEPYEEEQE
ncbi:hypothetical protein [Nodularia spumigena]|uniref:hypothetical protein n=1 Tax=Nodularia spumigena TaxID=70799 RepID=UPI002B2198F0|nr:hypothetical protein [Nodularia spumigena]